MPVIPDDLEITRFHKFTQYPYHGILVRLVVAPRSFTHLLAKGLPMTCENVVYHQLRSPSDGFLQNQRHH